MLAFNLSLRYDRENKWEMGMPYTAKQNKLFRAAEHNKAFAKKVGISPTTAKRLAHEGVKRKPLRTLVHNESSN